jgi:transcriptional regulator with XRE-family HTH domain
MIQSAIPARLKALREASGLSIRALAGKLGMSSSGYAHYESPGRFKDAFLPMRVAHDIATALSPLGINSADVLALAGSQTTSHPAAAPQGMAETAALPWTPAPAHRHQADTLVHALAPLAANPGTYQMTRDLGPLGLLRGDVVVIDRKAAPVAGDLALGNARTEDGGMITVIGRYLPPLLFTPDSLTSGKVLDVTNGDVAVYHPIIASFRAPLSREE